MARLNLVLALIAALALALAAPAFAYEDGDHDHGDHDHDHSSPAPNSAPDSPWACTAVCPDQGTEHPCGADKYVAMENYKTCALTETAIMAVDEYKTAEHVVACPSAVCETKCTASGPASGFHCFNTSVLMDSTALEANERGLAMGCLGSHPMGNMGMHMAGAAHGDCLVGHNHNDYMATGGAATSFSSVVVALVVALAAFALA